jgi:hypothetical protein
MAPEDTLFVVFGKPADSPSLKLPEATESELATIDGSWEVHFQPERGAPEQAVLKHLAQWNKNENPC